MKRNEIRKNPCLKCEVRRARYIDGNCERCHQLVKAEGPTVKRQPTAAQAAQREEAKKYNALISEGYSVGQIAQQWGTTRKQLTRRMSRLRKKGIKVTSQERKHQPQPPVENKRVTSKTNVHGGGRWGIRGCNCEACLTVRRQTGADIRERKKLKPS